jgi:hypothetical protein
MLGGASRRREAYRSMGTDPHAPYTLSLPSTISIPSGTYPNAW